MHTPTPAATRSSPAAGPADQPQESMGDAALHFLGRQLADTGMRLLQPLADRLQGVDGQYRVERHEIRPLGRHPGEDDALGHRLGGDGTAGAGPGQRPDRPRI